MLLPFELLLTPGCAARGGEAYREFDITSSLPPFIQGGGIHPGCAPRGTERASRIGRFTSAAPTASTMSAYHIQS